MPEPIARGGTAEIYPWQDGWVLKLFLPSWTKGYAQAEAEKARAVLAAGLPVPVVGELLEVGGRPGLLFERVAGISLTEAFRHRPWTLVATAIVLQKSFRLNGQGEHYEP